MTAPISNEPTTTRLHHYAGRYYAGPFVRERPSYRTRSSRRAARARIGRIPEDESNIEPDQAVRDASAEDGTQRINKPYA